MTVDTRTESAVVDTTKSAHARLRPVPVGAVTVQDEFWAPRMRRNQVATLPSQYRQLVKTGRLDNLLRVAGKHDGPFMGRYFNDSDVYKWIEAASWALLSQPDPQLEAWIDESIAIIGEAQRPDGYLNSYFELERADERWTDHDLHEMYCAGHLFQAAVAHYRATGARSLLEIALRLADHIDNTFGPEDQGKRIGTDGHPEVEMGLVELSRVTGDSKYLKLAQFLVDVRGHGVLGDAYDRFGNKYHQDHQPFRELDEIVGHAVRAVYLNAGVADIVAETGEPALHEALHRLWANMTGRKMYVSGGIGSRYEGESFGEDYELPNRLAYTETCAAIGSIMWAWRMLLIEGDARYADVIELQLYNAMLSGVSFDGETYFYQNPLSDERNHRRAPWFKTACCPPNVARTLASLPGYLYSIAGDEIWVHLYAECSASVPLENGSNVEIKQSNRYPWDGEISIEIGTSGHFGVRLRIPGWYQGGGQLRVNGKDSGIDLTGGEYALIRRDWSAGDVIALSLLMPVRRIENHPYVSENTGKIALMRGPLLYCVEQADNPGIELRDLAVPENTRFSNEYRSELLGGVVALTARSVTTAPGSSWTGQLYRNAGSAETGSLSDVSITAIPYYAWANREPGRMRVWLRNGE
jgi:DUF1680 family protein